MFKIKNNVSNQIEIKKSKFITYIYEVKTTEEVIKYLDEIKQKHKAYTHCTYAYILENKRKCSDDNEPSNTAGLPMLEVLEKKKLINVLVITIRYFGGIKLGAGGLIRAYSKCVSEILKKTEKKEYKKYITIKIKTNYQNKNIINKIITKKEIVNKEFSDNIIYTIRIEETKKLELLKKLENIKYDII